MVEEIEEEKKAKAFDVEAWFKQNQKKYYWCMNTLVLQHSAKLVSLLLLRTLAELMC